MSTTDKPLPEWIIPEEIWRADMSAPLTRGEFQTFFAGAMDSVQATMRGVLLSLLATGHFDPQQLRDTLAEQATMAGNPGGAAMLEDLAHGADLYAQQVKQYW